MQVTKVANASVSVTMKIFEQLQNIIQPTAVKFHHTVRRIDFWYHSTLGLRVTKKKKKTQ